MNKNVHYTMQFRKDFKLCIKRGYNIQQIKSIMKLLETGKELPAKNKEHSSTSSPYTNSDNPFFSQFCSKGNIIYCKKNY